MIKKYPRTMMAIHWITLIAVATAYLTSGNPFRDVQMGQIHIFSGLIVFCLFWLRCLVFLLSHKNFPNNPIHNPLQSFLFKSVKVLLYVLLLGVPVSGLIALSSMTQDYAVFGLPLLLLHNVYGIHGLGDIHQVIGNIFIGLIGLHACAALFHHFIIKDNVLKSML